MVPGGLVLLVFDSVVYGLGNGVCRVLVMCCIW